MRIFDNSLHYLITSILLLVGITAYSQAETNNWFFGYGAGMDFNGGSPTSISGGQVDVEEGSAAMSDENGNLLFYTDGETVWSNDHSIMANGTGLHGNRSTTQTLIVQKPSSDSIYYLFSINPCAGPPSVGTRYFSYSIIDISLNGGLGEVIDTNIVLFEPATERVTAVKHCNNKDIWIVGMEQKEVPGQAVVHIMRSYLLTSDGISTTAVETILPNNYHGCAGALKASPNGEYIAWDGNYSNFDKATGQVFNFKYYNKAAYGVEFSPNSKILYADNFQIELSSGDLFQYTPLAIGAMQLASDGKIYVACTALNDLAVIHSPNVLQAPGFIQEDFELLNGTSIFWGLGMPNFAPYYFHENPGEITFNSDCPNDGIQFEFIDPSGIDSAFWIFDGTNLIEGFNASYNFEVDGDYSITSIIYINGIADTTEHCIEISGLYGKFLGGDIEGCIGDTLELGQFDTIEGNVIWSTGETSSTIMVVEPGWYWAEITDTCGTYRDSIHVVFSQCDSGVVVPNIFTPNGDGSNDFFHVISTEVLDQFNGQLFNRWGEIVGELTDQYDGWDGTNIKNNAECSNGVYYYTLSYINSSGDSISKVGFFHLVR